MSHGSRRVAPLTLLALPLVGLIGLLAWLLPFGDDEAPPAAATTGPSGAATIGTTSYKEPDDAVFVAPTGDDSAPGTKDKPLRTVVKAVQKARPGGTIVLRKGTYHETVTIPSGKKLTLQSHPGEAAWFDGSVPVTGWRRADGAWTSDGWAARFDSSPSYTSGAPVSADPDFQFVDPKHPMAAHPDQMWIDGTALRQVGSPGEVEPGTFYVDERARRLLLGSDPAGHEVRASALGEAVTVRGAGSVLRGVGVRRYATALPQLGSVKVAAPDVTVENVAVTDSATTGLSVLAPRARVRHVTATRSGLLGIHANQADDLRLDKVRTAHNNTERFKSAPVSGGIKVTRSRKVAVVDSVTVDNLGKGIWMDESVYDITLTGNRVVRNSSHGISLELSAKAVVAGNAVRDNAGDGLRVNGTSDVRIWNNTLAKNGRTIHLVQDGRRPSDPSTPGRDPRQTRPDPAMTWLVEKITISNNTLADPRPGTACLLCVEDHSHERKASQMGLVVNGNTYVRQFGAPRSLIIWTPHDFAGLSQFKAATGQEARGQAHESRGAAGADGTLEASVAERGRASALPLPREIAKLVGQAPGTRHMGAWTIR
ncbi:right-handed parallel beta-helix repeat-containing protein [Spirillospora sp. CA-294931]|uniref:right-handed parallel beta-helix repeat-containing protein n=1 Tax=Spirillospora sp. CA-294931 TaxID=3240042 RepID=UPI003D8B2AC2